MVLMCVYQLVRCGQSSIYEGNTQLGYRNVQRMCVEQKETTVHRRHCNLGTHTQTEHTLKAS